MGKESLSESERVSARDWVLEREALVTSVGEWEPLLARKLGLSSAMERVSLLGWEPVREWALP